MIRITVNGEGVETDVAGDTPLLWFLRDNLQLTGTKYGCGMALCGACTVHLDGAPIRSCSTPVSAAVGKKITTIEGLPTKVGKALQDAWIAEEVPQCGYCQTGQMMSAAALITKNAKPSEADIVNAMDGNICRCGTYSRIQKAIVRAGNTVAGVKA